MKLLELNNFENFISLLFEDKVSHIANNQEQSILNALKQDNNADKNMSAEEVVKKLAEADPTKKALQWLVNQYAKGYFRLEDISRVKDVIQKFNKHKQQLPKKDINQYTFHQLEDELDSLSDKEEPKSKRQEKQQIKMEGVDKIHEDEQILVLNLKTKEAACYYGKNTKWCTASTSDDNPFDRYIEDGPIYLVIDKKSNRKWQLHFETSQIMDEKDRENVDVFVKYPILFKIFKNVFSGNIWLSILLENPDLVKYANKYNAWEKFVRDHWRFLLSDQPQLAKYADEYNAWQEFGKPAWKFLLSHQPQLAKYADKYNVWEKLTGGDWKSLLIDQPKFAKYADKYNAWEKLTGDGWFYLLSNQPQFAKYADKYNGWDQLDSNSWLWLLKDQTQFKDKAREYGFNEG